MQREWLFKKFPRTFDELFGFFWLLNIINKVFKILKE